MANAKNAEKINCASDNKHVNVSLPLNELEDGTRARIVELCGKNGFTTKLAAMGIIPGVLITKNATSLINGPIVIKKGATQIAIGFSMAQRVMVVPENPKKASGKNS